MTVQDGRTDVLVVAAGAPDLVGLRAHLGDKLEGTVRGLVIRSKIVGFGPGATGSTTTRGLLALTPRAVVMIGSCGVYPGLPQYQPHDVVIAPRVLALDHAVIQGGSEWPTPMATTVETSAPMVAGMSTARARTHVAPVAAPLAMTRSDSLASRIVAVLGAHVENTDVFGVACAASGANVPFACVFGVSNIVGSTGRADWQQFQREAVTQAANAVLAWVHAGAAGLPFG